MAILDGLRRAYRERRPVASAWARELDSELAFWDRWLETKGLEWPWSYAQRLDPDAELVEPLLTDRLERLGPGPLRVLDVGAGPVTSLGRRHGGVRLEVVAVDALAEAYDELLERHRVTPPVRTIGVRGESLTARFAPASFDVAYARNAVDHSADPVSVVAGMVEVVRPGGLVALRHYRNEGEREDYTGLHGWNLDARDGRLTVWRGGAAHVVDGFRAWTEGPYVLAVRWR